MILKNVSYPLKLKKWLNIFYPRALLGKQYDPLQVQSITAMQWALLERIGRAR